MLRAKRIIIRQRSKDTRRRAAGGAGVGRVQDSVHAAVLVGKARRSPSAAALRTAALIAGERAAGARAREGGDGGKGRNRFVVITAFTQFSPW